MTQNLKFSEPPTVKVLKEDWDALMGYLAAQEAWNRTVHQALWGLGGDGGGLDGTDNITSAGDPGVADGTLASATTILNALTANLKVTEIVEG